MATTTTTTVNTTNNAEEIPEEIPEEEIIEIHGGLDLLDQDGGGDGTAAEADGDDSPTLYECLEMCAVEDADTLLELFSHHGIYTDDLDRTSLAEYMSHYSGSGLGAFFSRIPVTWLGNRLKRVASGFRAIAALVDGDELSHRLYDMVGVIDATVAKARRDRRALISAATVGGDEEEEEDDEGEEGEEEEGEEGEEDEGEDGEDDEDEDDEEDDEDDEDEEDDDDEDEDDEEDDEDEDDEDDGGEEITRKRKRRAAAAGGGYMPIAPAPAGAGGNSKACADDLVSSLEALRLDARANEIRRLQARMDAHIGALAEFLDGHMLMPTTAPLAMPGAAPRPSGLGKLFRAYSDQ